MNNAVNFAGELSGTFEHTRDGKLIAVSSSHIGDFKDGDYQVFEQGRVVREFTIRNGKKNGAEIRYESGDPVEEKRYRDGVVHGPAYEYSREDKSLRLSKNYCEGRLDGAHITFYDDHRQIKIYSMGQLVSESSVSHSICSVQ